MYAFTFRVMCSIVIYYYTFQSRLLKLRRYEFYDYFIKTAGPHLNEFLIIVILDSSISPHLILRRFTKKNKLFLYKIAFHVTRYMEHTFLFILHRNTLYTIFIVMIIYE